MNTFILNSKIYYLFALCLCISACGFKLKQSQSLAHSIEALAIIEHNIDPNFINLLEKNLTQGQVRVSPLAATHLNILSYQTESRAASIDTRNARQTETRITKVLKFSLISQQGNLIIAPSSISQSREYVNDNNNISGKAGEERLLNKSIDREIVSLLLRRLNNVTLTEQIEPTIQNELPNQSIESERSIPNNTSQ